MKNKMMSEKLHSLLTNWQNSSHTVAISESGPITADIFIQDCSKLVSAIRENDTFEYILSCKNSYYFAVSFFALLHENKKVCLPPGMEKGCIDELKNNRILISDFYQGAIDPKQDRSYEDIEFKKINNSQISLFTSGSTGQRKEIKKSLDQFSSEVEVLNKTWEIPESSLAVSSVSHQHIYGLLFKLLLAMAYKRPFYIDNCLYEDQLNRVLKQYPHSYLISCPAHLDAMIKFPQHDFLKEKLVFSSGAPLSLQTSEEIKRISKHAPIEVFGSTETGGIAWRRQTEANEWQTMDQVLVKVDTSKTLWVNSLFAESQNEWYETGDKAELLSNKSFKHLGRKDRIAKVSGKRLSLDEMEAKLITLDYISECKVLILEERGHTQRDSTALIAVLSESGRSKLKEAGRRKFSLLIKDELKKFYTPVLLPRFWRYIEEFPKNSQGKINNDTLKLFFMGFDESDIRFPDLRSLNSTNDTLSLKFTVPKNCSFFDGHFKNRPILPGVAQVFWVQFYTEKILGYSTVKGINKLKFQSIIQPGDECSLCITPKSNTIDFKYEVNEQICSSGSLKYE